MQVLENHASGKSHLMTDEAGAFVQLGWNFKSHQAVNHSKDEYVRREGTRVITTNGVEGFFSLLKRGGMGTFHHISEQHLPLYLAEFDHRHNTRFLTDGERTEIGLKKSTGKRLTYRPLVGK